MIAKNDPAGNPVFYGVRLMEILAASSPNNWFWCPGDLNPADLLTRSGTSCAQINSKCWLNGSFLPQEKSSWPIILCSSITTSEIPILSVNLTRLILVNPSQGLILSLLQHTQSFSTVLKSLILIHKVCRSWRRKRNHNPSTTWSSIKSSIKSSILRCFTAESELLIANNKMKHLVIQAVDGVYYVSDAASVLGSEFPSFARKPS